MKSKKLITLLLTGVLTLGLISCTNKQKDTPPNNQNNNTTSENQLEIQSILTSNDLVNLIGKSKEDIIKIFGAGEENNSGNDLLGIYYANGNILGEDAGIDIGFNSEKNTVSTVGIYFTKEDDETYKKIYDKLVSDLGDPSSTEGAGENTSSKKVWSKDDKTISIIKIGTSFSISIE